MITTTNLTLRRFILDDAPFVFELLNTPTWIQYIGDRNIHTLHDAENYISMLHTNFYDRYNYGPLLVSLKEDETPIGLCGLFKRAYLDSPDIGFAFMPGHAGKGFGYESCRAIIDDYPFEVLYATTTDENIRSQKLIERCGLVYQKDIETPEGTLLRLYQRIFIKS
ncbi:N-acetyltransferase [Mucilaginibacter conchicola]|uniref:N-acetyltransferase n=1 Tax=Mucilaginibacter conchicola TaxID=2303333 RepID=A0A372P060_9SPHI|nr:GNAT family N-acetyltransferase [Mucilaginibacter conchicola]RFZ95551.1 N-acetyltransferase [Mucilaginibacter conchicola]